MEGIALPMSGVPQSSQNLEVGLLSAAHFVQHRTSGLPHSAQNFFAPVLSVPHFEQRIDSPRARRIAIIYHPSRGETIPLLQSAVCVRCAHPKALQLATQLRTTDCGASSS